MKFLDSEVIKKEIQEIETLQKKVDDLSWTIDFTTSDPGIDLVDYLHTLYALIDKQHVIYTRLSLTDDPDARRIAEGIRQTTKLINYYGHSDMNVFDFYKKMKEEIREQLIMLGQDLDGPVDLS